MAAYRRVYDSRHCRLTAKNRGQLRNPTLGNRVWASFTVLHSQNADLHFSVQPDGQLAAETALMHRLRVCLFTPHCLPLPHYIDLYWHKLQLLNRKYIKKEKVDDVLLVGDRGTRARTTCPCRVAIRGCALASARTLDRQFDALPPRPDDGPRNPPRSAPPTSWNWNVTVVCRVSTSRSAMTSPRHGRTTSVELAAAAEESDITSVRYRQTQDIYFPSPSCPPPNICLYDIHSSLYNTV